MVFILDQVWQRALPALASGWARPWLAIPLATTSFGLLTGLLLATLGQPPAYTCHTPP